MNTRAHAALWSVLLLMSVLAGCAGDGTTPNGDEPSGASSFETAGNAGSADRGSSSGASDAGAAAAPPPADDAAGERTVEEADLYRFVGDRLYVLNQFRGLYVFDVSNPDVPREIGRTSLNGYPVEMYVRGDRAYAILSDYYDYWLDSSDSSLSSFRGSRIVGIDLSDPSRPEVIGSVRLDGYVSDSRLVGDVIYAVANRYGWYGYGDVPGGESRDEMIVTSIDIADPTRMRAVQRETFPGNGWYVHATSDAFVIAGVTYDAARSWGAYTDMTYLDISSPTGAMRRRGHVEVAGYIQEDTAIHMHEGQLRVLTRDWSSQASRLRIFDATRPDELPLLGELDYEYPGGLFGTTFDGNRLYMVHYQTIDPLEVVDLSDPTHPVITGILEMPGWVDRIASLGDRLVGLGIDDTDGRRVSLSLFDVSDPSTPRLLDRLSSGSEWSWSEASWERKAWTVDAEAGIVLFPYSGYDERSGSSNHLGIVELSRDDLTARGTVDSPAPVERGALYENRVYALSQSALQVVDLTDRDRPVARTTVELARNMTDYAVTRSAGIELLQPGVYGWYGDSTGAILRTTPVDSPDSQEEMGRVEIPRGAQSMMVSGTTVLAIQPNDWCGGYYGPRGEDSGSECLVRPAVTVVSTADPSRPTIVATLDLPRAEPPTTTSYDVYSWTQWQTTYGAPYGAWYGGTAALDLGRGRFGLLRSTSTDCYTVESCRAVGIEAERFEYRYEDWAGHEVVDVSYHGSRHENELAIVDVSNPDSPILSALVPLGNGLLENPFVDDGTLVVSHARPLRTDDEGRSYVRYYMERFEITEDGGLLALGETNVPGVVIGLRDRGTTVLTVDRQWVAPTGDDASGYYGYYDMETTLNALELWHDRAYLSSSLVIGRGDSSVVLAAEHAYFVRNRYDTRWEDTRDDSEAMLTAVDVSDRRAIREVGEQRIGHAGWSIAARTGSTLALTGGWGAGLVLFDLAANPDSPRFERFVRTDGYQVSIREHEGTVFLCSGPYGLQAIDLE